MERLGLWGRGLPYQTFDSFLSNITQRGLGAAEMIAMEMKASGVYVSRGLSYHDTEVGSSLCVGVSVGGWMCMCICVCSCICACIHVCVECMPICVRCVLQVHYVCVYFHAFRRRGRKGGRGELREMRGGDKGIHVCTYVCYVSGCSAPIVLLVTI